MGEGRKIMLLMGWLLCGCRQEKVADGLHFTRMAADATKISFSNTITESDSVNVFVDEYMYNGGGVGVGDFNNDGLPDLFFCGSMVSSRLYINKGNFLFEDVTAAAGLETLKWCTGVSVVDINNDGFPDLYVCVSHSRDARLRKNLLFINDGALHFTEQAEAYGLADTGFSTQAVFFDYDKDGDLDMYLLNHQIYSHTANNLQPKDTSGNAPAQDRLYRNDGMPAGMSHPVFHDVSARAGIKEDGYGLGVVVSDVNEDGWPDVYVANDYLANDLLWLNNRDGTFTNVIASSLRHQSYNSMGTDAADINNDGLPDLAVVDMLPETNERKKMMSSATNQGKFDMQQRFGYEPSYVRNMLQLNNGNRKGQPFFSEIGQLAGIFETDWSWSVLMADLDNDGWKDMHITNGLGKDVTNNDYTTFAAAEGGYTGSYAFGGDKPLDKKNIAAMRKSLDAYGSVDMKSYLFRNKGGYMYEDVSRQAGIDVPSISNGAVYADLDNDGDLDLVTNNINQEAFVWRNDIRRSVKDSTHNFLAVKLKGMSTGCKATLYDKDGKQFLEESPVRGFCSSVDSRLYFGVGSNVSVDSLVVEWPDDRVQVLRDLKTNQWVAVGREDAGKVLRGVCGHEDAVMVAGIRRQADVMTVAHRAGQTAGGEGSKGTVGDEWFKETSGIDFKHTETSNYDFGSHQPLLQKYSQLGPCMAVGDVNGDGLEDLFVGGAANQSGKVFIQRPDESFSASNLVEGSKPGEDLGAVLFDADGDKDLDLLITGGSFEFRLPQYNQPRLYLNDGKGHFTLDADALPLITDLTKAVAVADYDGDGDLDVFIGGRLAPQRYPRSPRSYLLENDHGRFRDVTKTAGAGLEFPGMITGALFTDLDGDGRPDLVVCGEWMEVRSFKNSHGMLVETTGAMGLMNMHGLWRCIRQADVDKDGDMDLIVGNMGLNNKYGMTAGRPVMLYGKDMDKNGAEELIPAYYIKSSTGDYALYPALDRNQLAQEIPAVKKKYLLHRDFSTVTMEQLMADFGGDGSEAKGGPEGDGWIKLTCETAASVWLENLGNGKFKSHALPLQAQFAPVNCIVAEDVDGDGNVDLVTAGNEYQAEFNSGRYDASYGLVLKGDGKGGFIPVQAAKSGLILDGDVRDMKMMKVHGPGRLTGKRMLVVAPNDGRVSTYFVSETKRR